MRDEYNFRVKIERPEETFQDIFQYFKGDTLIRYAESKSLMKTQEKMTIRALELLEPRSNPLLLDAGSGPGFASIYLNEIGFRTVALDIISEFIYYYEIKELNPIVADMCLTPFKHESFDGIISISALQWIYRDINNKKMEKDLINFAQSMYSNLKPHSKAVFQFYPKDDTIMKEMGKIIVDNTDFDGNFVIDNPNSPKKRKIFLVLIK